MKILILANKFDTYTVEKLIKAASTLGASLEIMTSNQAKEHKGSFDIVINRISGITYNDDDLAVQKNIQGNPLQLNHPEKIAIFRDKYTQYLFYKDNHIETIDTLDLENASLDEVSDFEKSYNKVLIKPKRSNQAKGILSPVSLIDFYKEQQKKKDLRYVAQEFIVKDIEWRIFVINGKIHTLLSKSCDEEYTILNCEKSKLRCLEPSEEIIELVQSISTKLGLFYFALDVAQGKNGDLKIIETNCMPGMKYVDQYSKGPIAEALLSQAIDEIS